MFQMIPTPSILLKVLRILVKGTPQGDVNMKVSFEKKEGKLVGTMVNPDTQKEEPFNKLDTTEKGIIVYFSAQGYDVDMSLEKQDDDHVIGSVMNMLEVTGVRVKKDVTTLNGVAD